MHFLAIQSGTEIFPVWLDTEKSKAALIEEARQCDCHRKCRRFQTAKSTNSKMGIIMKVNLQQKEDK